MRRGRLLLAVFLLAVTLTSVAVLRAEPVGSVIWKGELIRLHVIANSDTEEDQRIKLCVRDALLKDYGQALTASGYKEACQAVKDNLDGMRETARAAAQAQGFDGDVAVQFGAFDFPTREYDGKYVPAGTYTALRVVLGTGAGHNWWCVMYPALCLSDADCLSTEQAAAPLVGAQVPEVRFESTVWTWLEGLFE